MASIWQRLTGAPQEARAAQPTIPSRVATAATPDNSLTLTAVYRAVQIIANPVSKADVQTFRYATGIGDQRIENPLFINRPSLDESRRETLFSTVVSLALEGNAFWLKSFGTNGQVNSITVLPASSVSINQDPNTGRKFFEYQGKTYTSAQIEHLRLFPRAGYLRGISPIESCSADLAAALDLRDYASNWFSSAGIPTGVLKSNRPLSKEQADEMTANWHNKQQNKQTAVLGSGDTYDIVELSPKDALFTEVQAQAVQQVARLFGIPARLLLTGIDGTSDTYSNLTDENQVFYRHTLMAYTDAIGDALSNCLPRGTRAQFSFATLFAADQASRFAMWNTALAGEAFMTVEEVRKEEGLNA